MGKLRQAIIVELLPRGILRFHGPQRGFWLFMVVCCSWDIVGVFSRYVVGGVANDPHHLPHPLICVIEFD